MNVLSSVELFRQCHVLLVCGEDDEKEKGRMGAASALLIALSHAERSAISLSPTQICSILARATGETAVFTWKKVQRFLVLRKSAQFTPLARWEPAFSAQDSGTRYTVPHIHQEGTLLCETRDLMKYRYLECVLRIFERRKMHVTECTFLPYTPVNGEANEHVFTSHIAESMKRYLYQDPALRVNPYLHDTSQ